MIGDPGTSPPPKKDPKKSMGAPKNYPHLKEQHKFIQPEN